MSVVGGLFANRLTDDAMAKIASTLLGDAGNRIVRRDEFRGILITGAID